MRTRSFLVSALCAALAVSSPGVVAAQESFPDVIPLPDGFQPEGIAIGQGPTFFAGSLSTGAIVRGDLRTGAVELLVQSASGPAVGIEVDSHDRVWVAGGPSSDVRVYDGRTGEELALYTGEPGFLNDVVVTRDAAYVTNSFASSLTVIPLGPGGALPDPSEVGTLPLLGFPFVPGFNANGIESWPDGHLIVAHSAAEALYAVDPATGEASEIELGQALPFVDGITRSGRTLYAVQNRANQIAVIALDPSLSTGTVTATLTNAEFDVPTTVGVFGRDVYAVNARFGTPNPSEAAYSVVATRRV
jgi:streptogramin lyase